MTTSLEDKIVTPLCKRQKTYSKPLKNRAKIRQPTTVAINHLDLRRQSVCTPVRRIGRGPTVLPKTPHLKRHLTALSLAVLPEEGLHSPSPCITYLPLKVYLLIRHPATYLPCRRKVYTLRHPDYTYLPCPEEVFTLSRRSYTLRHLYYLTACPEEGIYTLRHPVYLPVLPLSKGLHSLSPCVILTCPTLRQVYHSSATLYTTCPARGKRSTLSVTLLYTYLPCPEEGLNTLRHPAILTCPALRKVYTLRSPVYLPASLLRKSTLSVTPDILTCPALRKVYTLPSPSILTCPATEGLHSPSPCILTCPAPEEGLQLSVTLYTYLPALRKVYTLRHPVYLPCPTPERRSTPLVHPVYTLLTLHTLPALCPEGSRTPRSNLPILYLPLPEERVLHSPHPVYLPALALRKRSTLSVTLHITYCPALRKVTTLRHPAYYLPCPEERSTTLPSPLVYTLRHPALHPALPEKVYPALRHPASLLSLTVYTDEGLHFSVNPAILTALPLRKVTLSVTLYTYLPCPEEGLHSSVTPERLHSPLTLLVILTWPLPLRKVLHFLPVHTLVYLALLPPPVRKGRALHYSVTPALILTCLPWSEGSTLAPSPGILTVLPWARSTLGRHPVITYLSGPDEGLHSSFSPCYTYLPCLRKDLPLSVTPAISYCPALRRSTLSVTPA
nr:uncharacterized protein LOC113804529 [Penaeus vannamei]